MSRTIGLPEEPPVGTRLRVIGHPSGVFVIQRESDGWADLAPRSGQSPVLDWWDVWSSWGPASGPAITFEVCEGEASGADWKTGEADGNDA